MKYGTEEYYAAIRHLMRVVVKEGEAGTYTRTGVEEDGTTFLFHIVNALKPFGVFLEMNIEPIVPMEEEHD